jgi:hypothetical protein
MAARERTASPLGRRRLRERQVRVEGTFGLAKELHGPRRTRFKGRARVQIQLWMTAAAMNIKRAVRHTWPPGPPMGDAMAAAMNMKRAVRHATGRTSLRGTLSILSRRRAMPRLTPRPPVPVPALP